METTNIILIVGVGAMVVERIFKCAMRVKKSKCCGTEMEMAVTPTKQPNSLESSAQFEKSPGEQLTEIVKRLSHQQENKV